MAGVILAEISHVLEHQHLPAVTVSIDKPRPNPTFWAMSDEQDCSRGSEYHYHKHHSEVCEWKMQTSRDAEEGVGPGTSPLQAFASQSPRQAARAPSLRRLPWSHPPCSDFFLLLFREGILVSEQCFCPGEPSLPASHSCSASPGTQLLLAPSDLSRARRRERQLRGQAQREAPAQRRLRLKILRNHQELQNRTRQTEKTNFTSSLNLCL